MFYFNMEPRLYARWRQYDRTEHCVIANGLRKCSNALLHGM